MKHKIILSCFILLSFLITGFSGCDVSDQESNESLNLRLVKDSFFVGDTLKGTLTFTNITPNTFNQQFGTSCQFGLKITQGDQIYLDYPDVCLQVLTSLSLRSGESHQYNFQIPLKDDNGNLLGRGEFTIKAYLLFKNSPVVIKLIRIG